MAVKSTFFNFPTTQYKYRFAVNPAPALTDFIKIEVEPLSPALPSASPPVAGTGTVKVTFEAQSPGIQTLPGGPLTCLTNFSLAIEALRCVLSGPQRGGAPDGSIGPLKNLVTWSRPSVPSTDVEIYSVNFTYPAPGKYRFDVIVRANELFERPLSDQTIAAREALP